MTCSLEGRSGTRDSTRAVQSWDIEECVQVQWAGRGVCLSCSPTCSRMYRWQKQQGRTRASPQHSQPHERMMLDYLQEMSRGGLLGRHSQRRWAEQSQAEPPTTERKDKGKSIFSFLLLGRLPFSSICQKRIKKKIRPHTREQTQLRLIMSCLSHFILNELNRTRLNVRWPPVNLSAHLSRVRENTLSIKCQFLF